MKTFKVPQRLKRKLIQKIKQENPNYEVKILGMRKDKLGWAYKVRLSGELHREDGPAMILPVAVSWPDGIKKWYWKDEKIGDSRGGFTQEYFEQWKREHGYA